MFDVFDFPTASIDSQPASHQNQARPASDRGTMAPIDGDRSQRCECRHRTLVGDRRLEATTRMVLFPWDWRRARLKKELAVKPPEFFSGYRFALKGSPRHYDDVKELIEKKGTAKVYFGEALAYERGAGVALWRIRANDFNWLPALYEWWVEMERTEPIQFTFHLYLPTDPKYPVLDLRTQTPEQVAAYIREHAKWEDDKAASTKGSQLSRGQASISPKAH
jgi:hypothetical protein